MLGVSLSLEVFDTKSSDARQCVNSGMFGSESSLDFIDSASVDGTHYELTTYVSGFEDNVDILVLYNREARKGECILNDQYLSLEALDYGPENRWVRWPKRILIKNQKIVIEYTENEAEARPLIDVVVKWE